MACCRTCCATHRRSHIVIAVTIDNFRSLQATALCRPLSRISPASIDTLGLACTSQTIVGQRCYVTHICKEVALAFGGYNQSRIYTTYLQIDWLAPRAVYILSSNYPVGAIRWEVYIKCITHLLEIGGPRRFSPVGCSVSYRLPLHQITRVPNQKAWLIVVGRMGHIVILAILNNRWVGIITLQKKNLRRCNCRKRNAREQK